MARLRVRIELNRGGVGVPLDKLASVVNEARRFFEMLAEDVHITQDAGEWLGFDFDNESLNFTAEFIGPVSPEQVQAFCAAFDGTTSLRRATIAQFTQITAGIGEDELIGFGLYSSDQEMEPTEWRCLSRRDALRIADEIHLLQGVAGETTEETHLPAVVDSSTGARLFKDRSHRPIAASDKLPELVREVESNLSKRIALLEGTVENHSQSIRDLRETAAATEESFKGLLNAVENFCGQATRQLQRLSLPAELPAGGSVASVAPIAPVVPAPLPEPISVTEAIAPVRSGRSWRAVLVAAAIIVIVITAGLLWWSPRVTDQSGAQTPVGGTPSAVIASSRPAQSNPAESAEPTQSARPQPNPGTQQMKEAESSSAAGNTVTPGSSLAKETAGSAETRDQAAVRNEPSVEVMHVVIEAQEPVWVMVTEKDGKILIARTLQPNETRSLEVSDNATLRTGNAGGLRVRLNGKDLGRLGPTGKIRDIEFKAGAYKIIVPDAE